jgi:carbon-monoxide dehydrogenase medium subunit
VRDLSYVKASTIDEAVSLLRDAGPAGRVLAGGTDVIVQARERKRDIGLFVDIKAIPETQALHYDPAGGLTIGAALPCYRFYGDATVARLYPALAEATTVIGGVAIQGRASLGGNLCNSSPAADSIPAMIVLRASAEIAGLNGRRSVPVETFCTGPGQNVLTPGEFVVALRFPPQLPNAGVAWQRFIPRNEMDIAVANAASYLRFDGDTVADARVAIGAVAPTPLLVAEAADALIGRPLTDDSIKAAGAAAKAAAHPIDDIRGSVIQRRHLASVLVERTLRVAAERAKSS